jgi:hypothetical protein
VTRLVVDASVAAKWFITEPDSAVADGLLTSGETLFAPSFLMTELANIIWKRCLRAGLPPAVWQQAQEGIAAAMTLSELGHELNQEAFDLAVAYRHPVYDCLYLALASQLDCRVVTADRRFASVFASGATAGRVVLLDDWAAGTA